MTRHDDIADVGDDGVPDIVQWLREHPQDCEFARPSDFLEANPAARRVHEAAISYARPEKASGWLARGRKRLAVAAGFVAVAVSATTVGAMTVWRGQPSKPEVAPTCWSTASAESGNAVVLEPSSDVLEACGELWAEGVLPDPDEDSASHEVPPLVACVGTRGGIEVFPGETGLCKTLGMTAADDELSPENQRIQRLQERLIDENLSESCRTFDEVKDAAEDALIDSGFDGWTVTRTPGTESMECFAAGVNSEAKSVIISAIR